MSRADAIKASHRKEVTLNSGHRFLIRKITERDYLEEGVLKILLDVTQTQAERATAVREFYKVNDSNIFELEDRILRKAVVDPPITDTGEGDTITIADLAGDRLPLLAAISEFSGFDVADAGESKKSADAALASEERRSDGVAG